MYVCVIGGDFFLDEKIPRNAKGQGYVAVTDTSLLWKESTTADVFTYQGLTSCMEPDQTWTIMGSMWHTHTRVCVCVYSYIYTCTFPAVALGVHLSIHCVYFYLLLLLLLYLLLSPPPPPPPPTPG